MVATDLDGPVNNLLRYSIVSGDTVQQFSIHPRSGAITVRTALDREQVLTATTLNLQELPQVTPKDQRKLMLF